jgi:hypothetical protein
MAGVLHLIWFRKNRNIFVGKTGQGKSSGPLLICPAGRPDDPKRISSSSFRGIANGFAQGAAR